MDPARRDQDPCEGDHNADVIRFPKREDGESAEDSSTIYREEGKWRYHPRDARGRGRNFTGNVTYIGGGEGERLRGALAPVIRDLLDWAATHQDTAADSPEDRDDRGAA